MDDIDLDALDAKVEAGRTRLVTALRHLADRFEALPVARVTEALGLLAAPLEALLRWTDRALGGTGAGER